MIEIMPKRDGHRAFTETRIVRIGTVKELLRSTGLAPGSKGADQLLQLLPDDVELAWVEYFNYKTGPDWHASARIGQTGEDLSDYVRIRSVDFREYLTVLFFRKTGRVLRTDAREDVIMLIEGVLKEARRSRRLMLARGTTRMYLKHTPGLRA